MALSGVLVAQAGGVSGRVGITAGVLDVQVADLGVPGRSVGDRQSYVFRLWNHARSDIPIGNGLMTCVLMGTGGAFGHGIRYCEATFTIGSHRQRGTLTAMGPLRHLYRADLDIVGGTGVYVGSTGVLHMRESANPGELSLVFELASG